MKKAKEKGFTHAGKQTVKPIKKQGRKACPSSNRIISYFTGNVKQNSAVLCGNSLEYDDFDKRWERYVHMRKVKKLLLIAFVWICAAVVVTCACSVVDIFMGGNGLWMLK